MYMYTRRGGEGKGGERRGGEERGVQVDGRAGEEREMEG